MSTEQVISLKSVFTILVINLIARLIKNHYLCLLCSTFCIIILQNLYFLAIFVLKILPLINARLLKNANALGAFIREYMVFLKNIYLPSLHLEIQ